MMIKKKQRALIHLLVEHKAAFMTSAALAEQLSLSDRTVRSYLRDLKETLEENGGSLLAKQGQGYKLAIKNELEFNAFLSRHHFFKSGAEKGTTREASDRKHHLLNLLFLEEQTLDLEALSERLFISTSQLQKDIVSIKTQLLPFDLTLKKHKANIVVEGEEQAKRHFIMNYFFRNASSHFLQQLTHSHQLAQSISFDMLTIIILDECREAHLKLSDIMIQNIVLHLALSIKRLELGRSIQKLVQKKSLDDSVEYQVAQKIIARLESTLEFKFPQEEYTYLTLHLMTKSNLASNEQDLDLSRSLERLLTKMQQETGYSFLSDEQLKNGVLSHLKPMLARLEQNIKLDNPLLNEIKQDFPDIFELTRFYCAQLPELRAFEINDAEWGYLALHFLASLEKQKNEQRAKVLIICATGVGSAQLLKNRVENEFDERLNIVATKGYYEIDEVLLQQVDFIISSIDLSNKVFKVPVLSVSVFLSDEDVQKIRSQLAHYPVKTQPLPFSKSAQRRAALTSVMNELSPNYFYICPEKISKSALIDHLLDLLAVGESADYKAQMQAQIEKRTSLGEVIFSDHIAVPHPAMPIGQTGKVAIALIPNGLFWNERYPEIYFVFLISPSMYKNPHLNQITQAIVRLTENRDLQKKLLKQQNFDDFKSSLTDLVKKGV